MMTVPMALSESGVLSIGAPADQHRDLVSTLQVAGGMLTVDINHLDHPPFALLDDADDAAWWLPEVYGDEVAAAAIRLVSTGIEATAEVSFEPNEYTAMVIRLAMGVWLLRWWPSPDGNEVPALDTGLLELELGALAWHAEALFAGNGVARSLLEPQLELITTGLDSISSGVANGRNALVQRVLLDAAMASIDTVPDDERLDRLEQLVDRLSEQDATVAHSTTDLDAGLASLLSDDDVPLSLVMGHEESPRLAELTASVTADDPADTEVGWGRDSVDLAQVPPRVLSSLDDGVVWRVIESPGGRWLMTVSTLAAPALTMDGSTELFARVYVDGAPLPLTVIRLRRDERGFTGSAEIDPVELDDLVVDIYSHDFGTRPLLGPERDLAYDRRDLLRQIISARVESAQDAERVGAPLDHTRPFVAEMLAVERSGR